MDLSRVSLTVDASSSAAIRVDVSTLRQALAQERVELGQDATSGFDVDKFRAALTTQVLGRILLHSAELPSTQTLLQKFASSLHDGTVCVALRQTTGRGRRDNTWTSPSGCLMFSVLSLRPLRPALLPFLNYVGCIAVVRAVKKLAVQSRTASEVEVKIKWPNDVYFEGKKIGGVLLNSTFRGADLSLVMGIGLNVRNREPTTCLEEIFAAYGVVGDVSLEATLAAVLNELEPLLTVLAESGFEAMQAEYLALWLHSEQRLTLEDATDVTIKGIAKSGYLLAQTSAGEAVELVPDGNSLDMMQGLLIGRHKVL